MKHIFASTLIFITIILLAGCQIINNPEAAEEMAVRIIESTTDLEILEEPIQVMADPGDEEEIQEPFEHLLSNISNPQLKPMYTQWTSGEDMMSQRLLRVLFEDEVGYPELIAVNESLKEVEIVRGSPVEGETPITYNFSLDNLQAGESYLYALRDGDDYSEIHYFDMPESGELSFLVYGDLQGYKVSQYQRFSDQMVSSVAAQAVDGIIHLGDIVDTGDNVDQWLYYMKAMAPVSDSLPVISAIGNHDVKGSRRWYMDIFAEQGNGLNYENLSMGYIMTPDAVIAYIDTERPSLFQEQMLWLTELMTSTDKPFKIVLMHRSVYPIFYVEPYMQSWAGVFSEAGVDLVLSGHDHIYSRTEMDGVHYVVGGSGSGSKFYDKSDTRDWEQVVYDENTPVYMNLTIASENLTLESYAFADEGEKPIDRLTVSK